MALNTTSFILLLLLSVPRFAAGQQPRRLRANGSPLQTKHNRRRKSLLRVDDILVRGDGSVREEEKLAMEEEDEILWDRFLQGRQDSMVPAPTSNADTPPPTPAPTSAPGTPSPTVNANTRAPTAPPVTSSPTVSTLNPTNAPLTPAPSSNPTNAPVSLSPTPNPTNAPVTASPTRDPNAVPIHCGCFDCTEAAWDTLAAGFTCGERIIFVIAMGTTETDACRLVAGTEFPDECGPACDPDRCDEGGRDGPVAPVPTESDAAPGPATPAPQPVIPATPAPVAIPSTPNPTMAPTPTPVPDDGAGGVIPVTRCGCPNCGSAALDQVAGGFTCLARIDFLVGQGENEIDACRIVAGSEFGDVCGPSCDPDRCNGPVAPTLPSAPAADSDATSAPEPTVRCGCNDCADAYSLFAGSSSCGERIEFLMANGAPEVDACRQVAGVEFPFLCGPSCDPDRCDGRNPPLEARTPIYCFPEYENRQRFENMWGDYIVEVKEDEILGVCAPSFNKFSSNTVSRDGDELTLRYRKNGDFWEASEVRVVMPEDKTFQYGTFTWDIKSIQVVDVDTGAVRQDYLPPSLVFGMFTWDATEDFTVNENWNHEVDIELGRFGDPAAQNDAQFLVQPYTDSTNMYRFSTKDSEGEYQQAPQQYSFTWNPGFITWETTAGASGGTDHFQSTEEAITLGEEDYIQCLPADLEIRMNLWNLDGALVTPKEMNDNEEVVVVIDNFQYKPTGRTGVEDGEFCTKDCQCLEGSECTLGNNRCTPTFVVT